MELSNIYVDFKLAVEEGTSFFRVLAQCYIYEDSQDEPIQIGESFLHLFNPVNNSYLDLCGEADCLSNKLSYSLKNLEKFCEVGNINGLVAVFHTLHLKESWNERGLGIAIYKKLEEQLALLNVEWIVISNSFNLSTHFSELGFTSFKEEKEPSIMFKQISRTYDSVL